MDRLFRVDPVGIDNHGPGRRGVRVGRPRETVHRRHRRPVVRQRRLRPQGADRCGGAAARRPAAVLLLRQPGESAGNGAGRQTRRAGSGRPQSHLLQHRRLHRQRLRRADRPLLFRHRRQAFEAAGHLAAKRLSRQYVSGFGAVRQGRRQAGFPVSRGPGPSCLGGQLLSDAGWHRRRGGLLRLLGCGSRTHDRGARGGQHRVLLRRTDSWAPAACWSLQKATTRG